MEKKDFVLFAAVFVALGFSLYKRYMKNKQDKTGKGPAPQSGSLFSSQSKDDDYEPYSKK